MTLSPYEISARYYQDSLVVGEEIISHLSPGRVACFLSWDVIISVEGKPET